MKFFAVWTVDITEVSPSRASVLFTLALAQGRSFAKEVIGRSWPMVDSWVLVGNIEW